MTTTTQKPVMLKRVGVSQTLNGTAPDGDYFEIAYHHGGKYHFVKRDRCIKSAANGRPAGHTVRFHRLEAGDHGTARTEAAEWLGCTFDEDVEAYMHYTAGMVAAYPHLCLDVLITSATYEPGTDTIRHEPSNVALIRFERVEGQRWGKAVRFEDGYNARWACQINDALGSYNSNTDAHGLGVERKEWLAWLVGQYIREISGESPRMVSDINRGRNRADSKTSIYL